MLHVHRNRTDALSLVDVHANDLVEENQKQLFGKFSENGKRQGDSSLQVVTNRKLAKGSKG